MYHNVDLAELNNLVGDDIAKFQKYLNQFIVVISDKIKELNELSISQDRNQIKKIIHQIKPQLIFFGVTDIRQLVSRAEREIFSWENDELTAYLQSFIQLLQASVDEVTSILKANQN
jgi:HPt (histidine-containing phosphotransfer) domain-containing protein